jgi:peroxiredoxin
MRVFSSLLVCAALLLSLSGCGGEQDGSSPSDAPRTSTEAKSGKSYEQDPVPAPDLAMETLDGQKINLAEQEGKVVLVNFWATWCAPCRREIPDLAALYSELKSEGLVIVGVATDEEGRSVVEPFAEKHGINYPVVLDTSRTVQSNFDSMYGLPTTYVVNPDGQIVRRVVGIFPVDEMKPTLQEMLAESGGSDTA